MPVAAPHFVLLAESRRRNRNGDWRFVLQTPEGRQHLEAGDAEPAIGGERLGLLAVVRGLEALDQPSRVTLLTDSPYVSRGLNYGLEEWRSNNWQWERYGQMVPVKDGDLWRRLDHALSFHRLAECKVRRVDEPQSANVAAEESESIGADALPSPSSASADRKPRFGWNYTLLAIRNQLRELAGHVRLWLAQLGTGLLPRPWLE